MKVKVSDLHWSQGRWIVRFLRVKGGRERTLPIPDEVRRRNLHSDVDEVFLFKLLVNNRTLQIARPLSTRMVLNIVRHR